jgi:hypothetical protein
MITVVDILGQIQAFRTRIEEYYTAIHNEVTSAPLLADLSNSKTDDHEVWQYTSAGLAVILDGVWADRQKAIEDKINSFLPLPDRWLHAECLKFQYGDTLLWDSSKGKYYYAVLDETKNIIKYCAVTRSGGTSFIKVAKDVAGTPTALTAPELAAFVAYVRQVQWAGAKVATPISLASDKLNAPMTVYYDGTKPEVDIKTIVEAAFTAYLKGVHTDAARAIEFNGEYSINKHADYIESSSADIKEVNPGSVQAKTNAGAYAPVTRVYTPLAGYLEKDPAISFAVMITYVPV